MKKFLLSLAVGALTAVSVSAETNVVFDFASDAYGLTRETDNSAAYIDNGTTLTANDGVTVTLNKTEGKNGWRLWSDGLRIYKNSGTSMLLNAGSHKITGIAFEMAKASVIEGYSVNGAATVSVATTSFSVACDASEVNLGLTVTSNNGAISKMTVVLDGTPGETPKMEEVATLTDFIAKAPTSNVKISGAVSVSYQSPDKVYTFITDGTSNLEVYTYGGLSTAYKNGDQLTGVIGKYGTYNNMPQMVPDATSFGAATAGSEIAPAEVSLDKVGLSQYVVVKNVNIVKDGDNWNVTDGTTTYQLFNRFAIQGIKGLEGTTITGIGAVYGETQQLFPITIEGGTETGEGGDTPDNPDVPETGVQVVAKDFTYGDTEATASKDGYSLVAALATGKTKPAYHDGSDAIRLYASNTLTIKGGEMNKIVFTLARDAKYKYTTFTPSVGALNPAQAEGDTEMTWEGKATDVTFTVGEQVTMGSDEGYGQIRISTITIFGEAGSINEIRFNEAGEAVIYNLRGQRLSAPVKGLNIINGKKVLVK